MSICGPSNLVRHRSITSKCSLPCLSRLGRWACLPIGTTLILDSLHFDRCSPTHVALASLPSSLNVAASGTLPVPEPVRSSLLSSKTSSLFSSKNLCHCGLGQNCDNHCYLLWGLNSIFFVTHGATKTESYFQKLWRQGWREDAINSLLAFDLSAGYIGISHS